MHNDELQTEVVRHYSSDDVRRLRRDAELHAVDFSRMRINVTGRQHTVAFDKPRVPVGNFLAGKTLDSYGHTSPLQLEGFALDYLIKLHRAERLAVRICSTYGWSTADINRRPLTEEELSEYRARVSHAKEVAKLQQQLQDVIQAQARRAQQAQESVDLAARYSVAHGTKPLSADEATPDVLAAALVSGKPSKPRRARQRQEPVTHE